MFIRRQKPSRGSSHSLLHIVSSRSAKPLCLLKPHAPVVQGEGPYRTNHISISTRTLPLEAWNTNLIEQRAICQFGN